MHGRRGDSRRKESRPGGPIKIELQRGEVSRRVGAAFVHLSCVQVKLHQAENRWKPSVDKSGEAAAASDELETLLKKIRSILNKLCPQKFDTLVTQFNELPIGIVLLHRQIW